MKFSWKSFTLGAATAVLILGSALGGAVVDRLYPIKWLTKVLPPSSRQGETTTKVKTIINEESSVIEVASKVSPSVVTVSMTREQQQFRFGIFGQIYDQGIGDEPIEQDIGSGFVISEDGLIVTNKHVVSSTGADYKVVDKDNTSYEVTKIYRDPANDFAILKVNLPARTKLKPVEMGDSAELKVGQFVVAIGTALGEFRHTVTTGVVSGLGRGITAGSRFEGFVERLDNVIQTDAAINPGNSGGPLLDSAGQVIGINTAVSQSGQNIGFAIPINVIKDGIDNFNKTGQFSRPYLGVRYRMIDMETALTVRVPQGALVQEVIADSPASKAGIKPRDIITKIDNKGLDSEDTTSIAKAIANKKIGDKVAVEIYRGTETITLTVTLEEAK